ncbi:hypothetical protein LCGC14_2608010 [marine sediment metagenome]|uniref:Uncharacterized protein n=1 Tax=marine sediment metagenome TaxID=412755 RepID=A0A0F9CZJ2_9ZZZZ
MKPKTVQQWLDLPKDKRALELAKALTPEPWKHGNTGLGPEGITLEYPKSYCPKCHKEFADTADKYEGSDLICSVPGPITIDWNTAKYWQGKCDRDDWFGGMEQIYHERSDAYLGLQPYWIMYDATASDYLIAAAMAMGRKEG